jgi:DNA invertase Pin-like site-specific DNA recombinase
MTAAYIRVSGEAQLDGYGLDIQRDAATALATLEGLTITHWYSDEGISGTCEQADRPGLDELIVRCQDHPGTTVVLPKLDRLARSLAVQETVLKILWEAGATVLSADPAECHYLRTGDDPDDPTRTLIRQVLGAVAQFERNQIRMRLRAGKRRQLAAQGWSGGPRPYGWDDPAERSVLTDVATWRRAGDTWRAIAQRLNIARRHKRSGQPWTATEICRTHRRALARPGCDTTLQSEVSWTSP